ncbi:MAG: hypothetical protein Q9200_007399 [Gallowayella weberi]
MGLPGMQILRKVGFVGGFLRLRCSIVGTKLIAEATANAMAESFNITSDPVITQAIGLRSASLLKELHLLDRDKDLAYQIVV